MFSSVWAAAIGYFAMAFVSAVVPWVNAEVLMISAVPFAASRPVLAILVIAVSAGQMAGKALVYWVSRRSTRPRSPRLQGAIDRWQRRIQHRPRSAMALTFVSAVAGFPPFFLVSAAAGALGVAFGGFMLVGSAGRLIHFTIVAFAPDLLRRIV